jgi:uncharacterized SAM-binding protein YcdF (DUF218 family)
MIAHSSNELTNQLIDEITEIVFGVPSPPVQSCDIIFVFGGSHPGIWQTTAQAYQKGLGKIIIITGGHKPGVRPHRTWSDGDTPEAQVIRRELIKLSIPETVIVCEDKSTNTLENVLYAKSVYDFSKVTSILAVCKNYGVGRQCRTLKRQLPKIDKIIPYSFDTEAGNSPIISRNTWMNYESSKSIIITQVIKIIEYGKSGDLEPIDQISPALNEFLRIFSSES